MNIKFTFIKQATRAVACSWRAVLQALLAALLTIGAARAIEPIPSFYQEPGLSRNRDYVNQHANEHIDPFTGKLQLHYVDLFLPGNGGMDIKVQRSYSSRDEQLTEPNTTGVGWTMHFGRVLRRSIISICSTSNIKVSNAPVLELPDGSRHIMYLSLDGTHFITTNRYRGDCDTNNFVVTAPDGMRYEMTTAGASVGGPVTGQNSYYPSRIVDRNGNALNLTYTLVGGSTGVRQITASDGRTVTFNYTNNVVTSITDGTRTWRYIYDTSNQTFPFLLEVVRPDGFSLNYAYNMTVSFDPATGQGPGLYSLRQLTYPTGGTFDYKYGFVQFNNSLPRTTVVTEKIRPGASVLYAYSPATQSAFSNGAYSFDNPATLDHTYVVTLDGVHTYTHVGANSAIGPGLVYGIGTLLLKTTDSGYQHEATVVQPQIISGMVNSRPGSPLISDPYVAAPLPYIQGIQRNGQVYQTIFDNYDQYGNAQTLVEEGTTTNNTRDTRTTQRTFNVLTNKWLLHQVKDESIVTNGVPTGSINRTFDANGNMLTENKFGVPTEYTYTAEGEVASRRDARGNTVSYSSYKRGSPQSEIHPESVTISRFIDNFGNVETQTDGEGVITRYTYDGLNRLTSIVVPARNPVAVIWDRNSRVLRRGLFKETTTYDNYGRSVQVRVEGGAAGPITQNHIYDTLDRKVFSTYANSTSGTLFAYDALRRVTSTSHEATPIGGGIFGGVGTGRYTVSGGSTRSRFAFNQVANTTERNLQYVLTYRGFGSPDRPELMQVAAPDPSANIVMTRNGNGQLLTVQQGGLTHSYVYDSRYFLTSETIPETGTTVYGRDPIGNMISRQVGASPVTNYTYDRRNRLTAIQYPAGTPSVNKTWFRDDLISRIDNGVARRDYIYSPTKKLTRETLLVDGQTLAIDHAYDLNDAHAAVTYSTGTTVNYGPDALGWPTQAVPFASAVAFQSNGALRQLSYANGLISNFTIDTRQRPQSVSTSRGVANPLINISNVYDNSNNVVNVVDSVTGEQSRTFGYDALDRLQTVTMPGVPAGRIVYNGTGNILSQQLGFNVINYQYDTSNRLTSVSGSRNQNFSYDLYGNVASNTRNQFQYDNGSMLRCVDCGTANETRYDYDGAGMRVSESKGPFKTYFMYGSSGDLMFEMDSNGVKREYGYVGGRNIARKVTQ